VLLKVRLFQDSRNVGKWRQHFSICTNKCNIKLGGVGSLTLSILWGFRCICQCSSACEEGRLLYSWSDHLKQFLSQMTLWVGKLHQHVFNISADKMLAMYLLQISMCDVVAWTKNVGHANCN
jgi:hypothetical protein